MKDETQEFKRAISIVMKDAHFSERDRQKVMLKIKEKRRKRYPKYIIASVASIMIIGTAFTFGGTYIADAAETLINQLFGSREKLVQVYPDESKEEVDFFEQTLAIAKENLTEEEFNHYSQLFKEQLEIKSKLQKENREPTSAEAKRLHQIKESQRSYEIKFIPIQAQQLASFPFTKPTYIPKGYKKVEENYVLHNENEEPVVSLNYSDGESFFSTEQVNINQKIDIEMQEAGFFEKTKSYSLNGFQFDFVSSKEEKVGMRVTVPEKGYKIVLIADDLSKGEMEKVLLSMVNK
jgi:hypothetical protein